MSNEQAIKEAKKVHAKMVAAGHPEKADDFLFAVMFMADKDFAATVSEMVRSA